MNDRLHGLLAAASMLACGAFAHAQIPNFIVATVNWDGKSKDQTVVDREAGVYLGHPSTLLLEDGKTVLCVYPKGHGKGAIVYKRSDDGGKTWSNRLPTPKSWDTSQETPTLYRTVDAAGKKRVLLFSGLYPIRLSVSEDDGGTWSELKPVGDWGGIVAMSSVVPLKTGPGQYMALFHDDGRFFARDGTSKGVFTVYKTFTKDGGVTWSTPEWIYSSSEVHLCEPGAIRSPDGKEIAVLLRENRRVKNSHIMRTTDEGKTWTEPLEANGVVCGDRHVARYTKDGRVFVSFRDVTPSDVSSPTYGHWVAWIGNYDDMVRRREAGYRVLLKTNHHKTDCAYPGVEVLPNGDFLVTTYGHWTPKEKPYILSVRLNLKETDRVVVPTGISPGRAGS